MCNPYHKLETPTSLILGFINFSICTHICDYLPEKFKDISIINTESFYK